MKKFGIGYSDVVMINYCEGNLECLDIGCLKSKA